MRLLSRAAALSLCASLFGTALCVDAEGGKAAAPNPVVFREATKEAGLRSPLAGIMGHGGCLGDYDGDGLTDMFVGGFCDRPAAEYAPAAGPVPARLFRNLGKGKFGEVGDSPTTFFGRTSGAVFADLDNDGLLDLYVANNAKPKGKPTGEPQQSARQQRSQLFHNRAGKYVDVSAASGACPPDLLTARNVGVLDYDGDGLLDLLVVEDRFTAKPRSALLRNRGKMRFADVTQEAGLPGDLFGLGLAVADINGDGRPDCFVAHSNRLFVSQVGDQSTRYREAKELAGVLTWEPLHGEDWPCGAAFGDLNRDGLPDLVVSIHSTKARNKVFLNEGVKDGSPRFRDVTKEAGLGEAVPARCPHVEIQDFDNDGWPDIYVSAGWLDGGKVTPLIYRSEGVRDGLPRFVAPRTIKEPMVYYPAGPSGDVDGDGRLDLFLINWFPNNHCRLLLNESAPRNWLDVQVVGTKANRMGVGASVTIHPAGKAALLGRQEVSTGYGYASGQPAVCHFGLGGEAAVDVVVTLPGGAPIRQSNVKANQRLVIREP